MPRYLTPKKLCLLVLIELYASDQVPANTRLDVLSFIASHINASTESDRTGIERTAGLSTSDLSDFAQSLTQWQSGIPGRSMYDILLQQVWNMADLDSLHVLFHRVGDLVAPASPESQENLSLIHI